jgi:hypothetical protein
MAGNLKLHPYQKTYDEARRSKDRIKAFMQNYLKADTEEWANAHNLLVTLDEIIDLVPKQFRVTPYDLKKQEQEGEE